jgi:myo-inositol-hexaphosphate 3-phosphohydrolase
MSNEWEIYCTTKNEDGDIIQIGLRQHGQKGNGKAQVIDIDEADRRMKDGIQLYIKNPEKTNYNESNQTDRVSVKSITSKGITYLRSQADGEMENNLSQLPKCGSYSFDNP